MVVIRVMCRNYRGTVHLILFSQIRRLINGRNNVLCLHSQNYKMCVSRTASRTLKKRRGKSSLIHFY